MNRKVTIEVRRSGAKVKFEGIWSRADVDQARMLMLADLPKHLQGIRIEMDKQRKEKEEKDGRGREES